MPSSARPLHHTRWLAWLALLPALASGAPVAETRAASELVIAVIQLPSDADNWQEQREQVLAHLTERRPDVVAVIDVQQSGRANPACWLARRMGYECDFVSSAPPSQHERRGHALLTRHAVVEDGITLLHGPDQFTVASMQRLQLARHMVNVYVAQVRPQPDAAIAREHQLGDLRAWIGATGDGLPTLVVGDFAMTTSELVGLLPSYQPARRNPSMRRNRATSPAAQDHGLDVLYQVRQFADVAQHALRLPAGADGTALPLGTLATIRLLAGGDAEAASPP